MPKYCISASELPQGFSAYGALGKQELEEAALYVLDFSRTKGDFVSVSEKDLLSRFKNGNEKTILKGCGGESRLMQCVRKLVSQKYLYKEASTFIPTPLLVQRIAAVQ